MSLFGHALRRVSNPKILWCKCMPQVWLCTHPHSRYIAPSKQKDRFPLLMHEIYVCKHLRKPHWLIDRQKRGSVDHICLFQVKFAKHLNHCLGKLVHWLKVCGLAHAHILVNENTINSMSKEANRCRAYTRQQELTSGILLAFEVGILVPHTIENSQEQFSWHPKAAPEYVLR
jgi:hypothetical protein